MSRNERDIAAKYPRIARKLEEPCIQNIPEYQVHLRGVVSQISQSKKGVEGTRVQNVPEPGNIWRQHV